jgi:IS30 family transposase
LHVYVKKATAGDLHKNLRSQKPRRKRHLCGRERRRQIPNRRPISERASHVEQCKHKQPIVTLVKHKSGYVALSKLKNSTADLAG